MKKIMALATIIIPLSSPAMTDESVAPAAEQSEPSANTRSNSYGLADLDAMTFSCPGAALNAAAREAAKAPSQGRYYFSYFNTIMDSHHSTYEVHFKSNYLEEPDLRYCVYLYCQQGWDPSSTMSVTLMSAAPPPAEGSAGAAVPHVVTDCGDQPAPVQR